MDNIFQVRSETKLNSKISDCWSSFCNLQTKFSTKHNNIMDHCVYDSFEQKYVDPISLLGSYDEKDLEDFKHDDNKVGKVIYCFYHYPEIAYDIMFNALSFSEYNNMSKCYYCVNIKCENNNQFSYNFEPLYQDMERFITDLYDDNIRFITIRINENASVIGHVTTIIIDKNKKYILFFDPKNNIKYDIAEFKSIIETVNKSTNSIFEVILPFDIGYNKGTKLQGINLYCHTYIYYVYMAIICNPDVCYKEFKTLFNSLITYKNISILLYLIYRDIEANGILSNVNFKFPCISNALVNIFNNISICIRFNITKLKNWYTESIYNVEFEESECIIKYFEDENFYSDFDEKLIDYDNDEIVDDRL